MAIRIALVGNPNCGKSTLFNAVTGAHARTGNWQGVTVGALSRRAKLGEREFIFTDLPGLYSLQAYSMEEKEASAALNENFDAAVCVADEAEKLIGACGCVTDSHGDLGQTV